MTVAIDLIPDPNLDRVARITRQLAERIRDEDPATLFRELQALCREHPAKAAQIIVCFAAWFDPDEEPETLVARARAVTTSRVNAILRRTS